MLIRKLVQRMLLVLLAAGFLTTAIAQSRAVTGTVTDANGNPIAAVTVRHAAGTASALTNESGVYSISVPANASLEFSYVGYQTQTVNTGNQTTVNVVLQMGTAELGEVVVTALGIKRERKALGYAVQEIKGADIVQAREPNVANALTGKVAGLQVVRSSTGPAGSSKIVLRGFNSLTGNNQPLVVVDGVPIENFAGASNNDFWIPSLDMGNGLGDINSEDIESLTVLKGGAAAALYGSRAGNGVIMITTKSGRKTPGLGITVSSSIAMERPFMLPELQTTFGQGSDGAYDERGTTSWGPSISGQQVKNWDGTNKNLTYYDNFKNYFEKPGISSNQNISFQQQFGGTAVYASYNRIDDKSFIPGVKLIRNNLTARQTTKFGKNDKWEIDTKIQYGKNDAFNRPVSGFVNIGNQIFNILQLPNGIDIREFENPWNDLNRMKWYTGGNTTNPYWTSKYNLNNDTRNRYLMTGSIKHHIADWLTMELKAGTDRYSTDGSTRTHYGSPLTHLYTENKISFFEDNYSLMFTGRKDELAGSKWGTNYSLGGNMMKTEYSSLNANSGELEVPNLFALNNGVDKPTVGQGYSQRQINSVYGSFGINYDGFWFFDVTARNDWSSALSKEMRSYFYPSFSTSLIVSDMMRKVGNGLPPFISYAKIRGSVAQVGNDMGPYQLYNSFFIGKDALGNTTAWRNNVLFNPNVRSELIRNLEAGVEVRLFRNRFGVDFTWYKSNATRQLLNLPLDPQSGYSAMKINAGDIQNEGMEVVLDASILRGVAGGLNWDMRANFSRNRNTIVDLHEDVTRYQLGGFENVRVVANIGGTYGEIMGSKIKRVEDKGSPYFGQPIVDNAGLPEFEQNMVIGDQQADYLLGWTNTFSYKGFSLSMLIDGRFGGEIYSASNSYLQNIGKAAVTAPGGERPEVTFPGVVKTGDNTYQPNTVKISQQQYWQAINSRSNPNLGISEYNLYDATNMRIRTLQVGYEIPKKWVDGSFIQRARASVSMNNVLMLRSHLNGIDPESVYATGTNAVGFENSTPPTMRMVLFNLTLGF